MYGFKPTTQRGAENSGMVRGPGTGTSDSVTDAVPPGTYIMPADSTAQIGPEQLAGVGFKPGMRPGAKSAALATRLGFKGKKADEELAEQEARPGLGFRPGEVPVNLSNGEYKLPPEQVHAVGAQVLDAMKDATHEPAQARGFRPGMAPPPQKATDALYFADGGLVTDMNKPRPSTPAAAGAAQPAAPIGAPRPLATSPSNTYPGSQSSAVGNIYAKSNADLAKGFSGALQGLDDAATYLNRGDPVKDAAQAVGGFFARSAEQARQPNAWDDSGMRPQFADAKPQPAAVVPAKPAASGAPAEPGTPAAMASAKQSPATTTPTAPAGFPDKPTSVAGVTRTDEPGKSPLFSNVGAGGSPAPGGPGLGFQPGVGGGPEVLGILQRENQIRAGMGPLADQVAFNNGTGGMFRNTTNDEILRRMLTGNSGKERRTALDFMAGRQDAANRTAQSQQEIDMREMDGMSRRDVAAGDLELRREAAGFQTAAARRLQDLQDKFMAEKDPAKRAELAQTIRDLNGREPAKPDSGLAVARANLIGKLSEQYAAMSQMAGENKKIPSFEAWSAPLLRAAGMGAPDPRQQEGVMLRGKDGKMYRVQNGVPVPT